MLSKEIIEIPNFQFTLYRRRMKNIKLTVDSTTGEIKVSAPKYASKKHVKNFVLDNLSWIKQQQEKVVPEILIESGEKLLFLGEYYQIELTECACENKIILDKENKIIKISTRPIGNKKKILEQWYRDQLNIYILELIQKWQPIVGKSVSDWGIRKMKTRWGSCNIRTAKIWLNLELIKHPFECLDYVVLHEMTHLLEASHNQNFKNYLTQFMPSWRKYDKYLNKAVL